MRIGFIGLGRMGASIALNLIKAGHALAVHDARRDAAALHLERGARWAESPRLASLDAELVFTCLPGPAEVEAIALGDDGIVDGAAPGAVYADLSSGSPSMIRRIHGVFEAKGLAVLDAPVSGGVTGAERGTLQVMVGGDEASFVRIRPVLAAIGDKVSYTGVIGSATITMRMGRTTCQIWHQAICKGGPDQDYLQVVRLFEEQAGVKLAGSRLPRHGSSLRRTSRWRGVSRFRACP